MKSRILVVIFGLLFLLPCIAGAADQFFDSNGVKIRYVVAGSGEPIILIHPFVASAEIWQPLIKDLSQNYQLIAMDCRGHGKSEKPHDPKHYGIEMVNDVVRLMDHLGIKKSIIVGYSMGRSIGMKMLTENPGRISMAVIGGSLGFTKYRIDCWYRLQKSQGCRDIIELVSVCKMNCKCWRASLLLVCSSRCSTSCMNGASPADGPCPRRKG